MAEVLVTDVTTTGRRSRAAYAWTSESPNFTDFQAWVANMMGVPANDMPDVATLQMAYDESLNLALIDLATIPYQSGSPSIYALAIYNLAAAILVDIVQDVPPSTYWSDLRSKFGTTMFSFTIVTSASDQGTSKGSMAPEFMQHMMPMDLWLMQTPWGRQYLMIAGAWGAIWGIS
jgi:hypothetical protein